MVPESFTSSCSQKVCLQSQDDSLIRQTVTLQRAHEYPVTDVHVSQTHGLFLHSISIKHTAQPCPVTRYKAGETKATHVFMYRGWMHASMYPCNALAEGQMWFSFFKWLVRLNQTAIKWRWDFYCNLERACWNLCILKEIPPQMLSLGHTCVSS